jgi:ribonucleotide reductase alpha subunit
MVNADEGFRRLGTVDARVGMKIGDDLYEVTFEAFECTGVKEIDESTLRELDFWLEQTPEEWRDMIENIKTHGAADLSHTLNTIDLTNPEGFAKSYDGYKRDAFYRFNQSLQHFFDSSAKVDTQFAVGAGA